MSVLSSSIEADVPVMFADREWSEFVWRSLYGSYAKGFADVSASLSELDADSGKVTFEKESEQLARVSVELEYTPPKNADRTQDLARAQEHLDRDLQKFRTFVERRCDQSSCRAH
jgi:uncharacterized membrane protein